MAPADRKHKILVVDDEPETAEMFALMLQLHGYQVAKAHGTTQAIQSVIRESPDAVLLDVMMPDVSGLELCRFVRRDPRTAELPVIIVSAKARPEDIRDGLEAGATKYLTKPVAQDELLAALKQALGG